jgi:crotonobetainyl-CoA:carnitine CoA-transferase CaiB-like acyl-CoA transferase
MVLTEAAQPDTYRPTPALGQHTDEILNALGYDSDSINRLRTSGVI